LIADHAVSALTSMIISRLMLAIKKPAPKLSADKSSLLNVKDERLVSLLSQAPCESNSDLADNLERGKRQFLRLSHDNKSQTETPRQKSMKSETDTMDSSVEHK
jgi:hypothetical protein